MLAAIVMKRRLEEEEVQRLLEVSKEKRKKFKEVNHIHSHYSSYILYNIYMYIL
jgi:hypothetical protein